MSREERLELESDGLLVYHLTTKSASESRSMIGVMSYLSYRAYQRTNQPYLRNAAIGFAFVEFEGYLEGVLFELLDWYLVTVYIIESVLVAVGFGIILFSLLRLLVALVLSNKT